MTEDQKYQGALYKEKNKKLKTNNNRSAASMAQPAYVEDVDEWRDYEGPTEDERSPAELLAEAPTPPPAVSEHGTNVFDYLVATGQTPNASDVNLVIEVDADESKSLVPYKGEDEDQADTASLLIDERLVEYGSGPYETPAATKDRRRRDGDVKSDKKRKRLHVDVPGDSVMTDAPPVLSSGLTGGLKGLMRPSQLPPSPEHSGADATPASPIKKSKSKHSKGGQVSNSLFSMIAGNSKSKTKKRKTSKKSSSRHKDKGSQMIVRPGSSDGKANGGEMILFPPDAHTFFNYVNKGPDSERGCSMNKALKRFHRERLKSGAAIDKNSAEKELWRSLRLRRNEQGEIVLFSI